MESAPTQMNIVFDFGCVLVDLDKQRCVEAFKAIGAGAVSAYVDECRQEDLFHDLETGAITVEEFCCEVRRKSPGCTATDAQICHAWNALLTGIPQRRIERLVDLGLRHRLFLLSNTNAIHWTKAVADYFPYDGKNVTDYFQGIFLSYEMHMVKPETAIFEQMLHQAGIDAADTLFIDDSPANCAAAEALGIRSLHVRTGDEWLSLPLSSSEGATGIGPHSGATGTGPHIYDYGNA